MTPPDFALDHVAVGAASVARAAAFVVGELGGEEHGGGPGAGFGWYQWRFAGGGRLEVLEPAGPPGGFLHRFLESRGPGVHHVTFKVPSLEAAARRVRDHGYDVVGWFDADPSWKEFFLHPRQAQGIVVQLAEENPPSPDAAPSPEAWPEPERPPRPADAPRPVTLRALRVAARSAEAARRQWGALLGGEARTLPDGAVEWRWPDSPLAIVVELRPDADEGPLAIELSTDRAWPSGGVEALGTRFVRREAGA